MRHLLRLCLFFCSLVVTAQAFAQTYANEWIDYNKTYYKFKTGKEGIYRISKAQLDAIGFPAGVSGNQIQLFRDGQQLPIFTSTNGIFGPNDFIEFFGETAHGRFDKQLYEDTSWHPNPRASMFSDSASYFLTYDASTNNARYTQTPNIIPPSPPTPLPYCFYISSASYTDDILHGDHIGAEPTMHVSLFYKGEALVQQATLLWYDMNTSLPTPNATTGAQAVFRAGIPRNTRLRTNTTLNVSINGQNIANEVFPPNDIKKLQVSFSPTLLTQNNAINFVGAPNNPYDWYGISYVEIEYPRNFNLNGLDYFKYKLLPSSASQYIEFIDFNHGGIAPRLYDLTNKKWYSGDISQAGKTRFYLEPSLVERHLVLFSQTSSELHAPVYIKPIQFTNYQVAANQGNYIIVTHPAYQATTNGRNYVEDYKDYRQSTSGGSHSVIIADVTQLYDQFAYGIEMHPLAIQNFLKYAYNNWSSPPVNVFIIGKGLYYQSYRKFLQNPSLYPFPAIVPTYGDPGADICFVNFLPNKKMAMNIGRLSVWNTEEIGIYLERVKSFETAIKTAAFPTHETESWKKKVLHAVGGKSLAEQNGFVNTMQNGAKIISDTSIGATVYLVRKNTTVSVDPNTDAALDSLINSGLSMISFHGHSSPNGFEFNLNNPEQFQNAPRIPHFMALGCDVAQIFSPSNNKTISEKYLLNPAGGSATMIASNNPQLSTFHASYLPIFYTSLAKRKYGQAIGVHHRFAYDSVRSVSSFLSDYMHIESLILQGDPAISFFGPTKPDYHISTDRISSIPVNVTTNLDSFTIKIVAYNLGRALHDTVPVKIEHINPAGTVTHLHTISIADLYFTDTIQVSVPLNKIADIGLNRYKVTIDPDGKFDEISEANNTGTLELFIYSDNLIPVYPPEFAIVHKSPVTLKASTLNPFRPEGKYLIEIDTTERFNSPLKQQTSIVSKGGVIRWTPNIPLRDSVVYYWRTAYDSLMNGNRHWSYSSFIFLEKGSPGWNQSHHFQYLKNSFDSLVYNDSRSFSYPEISMEVKATSAIFHEAPGWPWNDGMLFRIYLNGSEIQRLGCPPWGGTIQVMVFDGGSGSVWENDTLGTSGAYGHCTYPLRSVYAFEFPVWHKTGRDYAKHFLDSIPTGNYVLIRNLINQMDYNPSYIDDWKSDTLINGSGNSLYHTLWNLGFTKIDSFYKMRPLLFFRKKNDNSYPVYQFAGVDSLDRFEESFTFPARLGSGKMLSTVIGPAQRWDTLKWKISAKDNQLANDVSEVSISGINQNNIPVLLYRGTTKDTGLSFINAQTYPQIQMTWHTKDTVNRTSPHLDYWRVLYEPVPEAALNPSLHYVFIDSIEAGQLQPFSVAIENISDYPMDSMLVRYRLIDHNSNIHELDYKRYKKLSPGDTLHANYTFDPRIFAGNNVLFIEANPNNDQPELYHPNNIGYIPFSVATDKLNPFVDVTFDGVHILNKDIVSSKPYIRILVKDENKYLKLDDTSLISLKIRFPSDYINPRTIPFDGTICKFIPAANEKNEAVIEYRPNFTEDGEYQLIVNARDKSGNVAGKADYEVSFEVINKSSITNVLNYPNPFSTATAFVFTLTGSEIPTHFKIQIMTVTGKVVREITQQELGPIRIGRNMTEYKWDGRDQYGQLLGNGVYLYRVVSSIHGKEIEHRQSGADKFYKNGYGKLYIMR